MMLIVRGRLSLGSLEGFRGAWMLKGGPTRIEVPMIDAQATPRELGPRNVLAYCELH